MVKGILYSLLARASFVISAYAMHMLLARVMGPAEYGSFGILISLLTVCYIFTNNGVKQQASQLIAIYPEADGSILARLVKIQFLISLAIAVILVSISSYLANIFHDERLQVPLCVCAIVIIFQAATSVYAGALNGRRHFGRESLLGVFQAVARAGFTVVGAFLISDARLAGAMYGYLIFALVTLVISWRIGRGTGSQPLELSHKQIFGSSFAIVAAFGFLTLCRSLDLMVVKAKLPATEAGFYAVASSASQIAFHILLSFGLVCFPYAAKHFHENDHSAIRKLLEDSLKFALLLLVPIVVCFTIFGEQVITFLFGSQYLPAAPLLETLIWGMFSFGIFFVFAQFLLAANRRRELVWTTTIVFALTAILNVLLVDRFGAIGAAFSTTISGSVASLYCIAIFVRDYKLRLHKVASIAFLTALSLWAASALDSVGINLIVSALVISITFLIGVGALKVMTIDEGKRLVRAFLERRTS
ncbi:MAG: polysaccharide biosynthesis protein [Bdellovibrionales bacterium]|nr:polysaccharide biosynthesis protein [Bdellovibrionales bacterium]